MPNDEILWMKLPLYADPVPEDTVIYLTDDTVRSRNIQLAHNMLLEKGFERFCENCGKMDHFSWKCPDEKPLPFSPMVYEDMVCEHCGADADHPSDCCPMMIKSRRTYALESEMLECCICRSLHEHDTEDCPKLAASGQQFCFWCMSMGDHSGYNCPKPPKGYPFCTCCSSKGHLTNQCPKEFNDGRKYCAYCNKMGKHTVEDCHVKEFALELEKDRVRSEQERVANLVI